MARSTIAYGEKTRRKWVVAVLLLIAAAFVARMLYLQTYNAEFLVQEGLNRSQRPINEHAQRGMILDRQGEPLAISSVVSDLIVNPQRMWATLGGDFERLRERCLLDSNIDELCSGVIDADLNDSILTLRYNYQRLKPLAMLLNTPVEDLYKTLDDRRTRQEYYLKRRLSPAEIERMLALGLPGFERRDHYQRFYPNGALVGKVVGFTDINDSGQEGMERVYNNWLSGQDGLVKVIQDPNKNTLRVVEEIRPPSEGAPLQLSIDKRIQYVMHSTLEEAMNEFDAASVTGVMVDVQTGEVLAMVSLPAGNPNNSRERVAALMKNHVMTDVFEPGSTIKPFAVAAALEARLITPQTVFKTDRVYRIGRNTVKDTHWYGELDTVGVIRKSSNVGMAMISRKMPRAVYYDLLKGFGFGARTGIKFPGEQSGVLRDPDSLNEFEYATTTFGYGLSTTALQLAHGYATLANDGVKVPLSLLKQQNEPQGERIISSRTAQQIKTMLIAAVEKGGTGTRAQMPSYTVAGKTGTSHKIIDGAYDKERYRGFFAGYAPASNPRIAMVIVVDDPKGDKYYGGLVAAPAFSKIGEWALNILGVLPDKVAKSDSFELEFDVAEEPTEAQ
ncbi:penicillin-binding protein 2 [Suttonella sp. R2A3]|uniref:peptidoglycan D,D-transpeptidase FtsI family protein n=1 Tax=Suttonella sp. R2A3 TaxID=2908648 RepID=UPI001F408A9C|nr:penicillin-binding protein 2 [Suttonella sp. R2A3]UJF24608.1 penicillin-binding protein 2 [Suttonella sp. R2A3]